MNKKFCVIGLKGFCFIYTHEIGKKSCESSYLKFVSSPFTIVYHFIIFRSKDINNIKKIKRL